MPIEEFVYRHIFRIAFLSFLFFTGEFLAEEKSEDLFELAFGRKEESLKLSFVSKLKIDGVPKGEVLLHVKGLENFLDSATILNALQGKVFETHLTQLRAKTSTKGLLSFKNLKQLGFYVTYDEFNFLVEFTVPADFYLKRTHDLGNKRSLSQVYQTLTGDAFSSGLNYSVTQSYNDTQTENGLDPLQLNIEPFFNWHNLVYEGNLVYRDRQEDAWNFKKQCFSYDFPDKLLRLAVGDLRPELKGFQGSVAFGGISLVRNYEFMPMFRTSPQGEQEIFLETPSIVEIYVNGHRREQLKLSAGTHFIKGIPGYLGRNDVELKITDSFNRMRNVKSNFLYESKLLEKGLYRYAVNIGFKSESTGAHNKYLNDELLMIAFYEKGLFKDLTLLTYAEVDKHVMQSGLKVTKSFPMGNIHGDFAVSHIKKSSETDSALNVAFSSYPEIFFFRKKPLTLNASMLREGRRFASLSAEDPEIQRKWSFFSNVQMKTSKFSSLGLSGRFNVHRGDFDNAYQLSLQQNMSLKNETDWSVDLSFEKTSEGLYDRRASISINWGLIAKGAKVSTYYETEKHQKEINFRQRWRKENQSLEVDLSPSHDVEEESLYSNVNLETDYFYSSLFHSTRRERGVAEASYDHSTIFSFSSALLYSGGHFAISQNVKESFLIVGKDESIQDYDLYINPVGNEYLAKSRGRLPAVLANLRNYYKRDIYVDVTGLPVGYALSDSHYILKPGHRNGFYIELASLSKVLLRAYLFNAKGEPLTLKLGRIISENTGAEEIPFFTNRTGKFQVLGLKEGQYRIELSDGHYVSKSFKIPKGQEGIYRLGHLTMEEK